MSDSKMHKYPHKPNSQSRNVLEEVDFESDCGTGEINIVLITEEIMLKIFSAKTKK